MNAEMLSDGLLWGLAFIFSTTCHEAAHAWAAMKGGDLTAYEGGQVTLNPLPHIKRSPFGMVVVPIVAFALSGFMIGWASIPYDRFWAERHPKRAAWMSLAGPAANFALAFIFIVIWHLAIQLGLMDPANPDIGHQLAKDLIFIMVLLNIILGVFNLIPLPPLDGSEVVLLFFPESEAPIIRQRLASVGIFGLFIAWALFRFIAPPLINMVVFLLGG